MACIEPNCGKEIFSKGRELCAMHYYRFLRHGSTLTINLPLKIRARNWDKRFWSQVEKTETCWTWKGAIDSYGYGVFQLSYPERKTVKAHRTAYELMAGPIPTELTVDHTCVNAKCVNPNHMDIVSASENSKRAARRRAERIVA